MIRGRNQQIKFFLNAITVPSRIDLVVTIVTFANRKKKKEILRKVKASYMKPTLMLHGLEVKRSEEGGSGRKGGGGKEAILFLFTGFSCKRNYHNFQTPQLLFFVWLDNSKKLELKLEMLQPANLLLETNRSTK